MIVKEAKKVDNSSILNMFVSYFDLQFDDMDGMKHSGYEMSKNIIFLIISGGIKLPYGFQWHNYSVQSKYLRNDMEDIFCYKEKYDKLTKSYKFNERTELRLEKIKKCFNIIFLYPFDEKTFLYSLNISHLSSTIIWMNHMWGYSYDLMLNEQFGLNKLKIYENDKKRSLSLDNEKDLRTYSYALELSKNIVGTNNDSIYI